VTTSRADSEAAAFLGMTENLRDALIERTNLVRPFQERYERLQDDPRTAAPGFFKLRTTPTTFMESASRRA
jgi:hypothetical protein